MIAKKSERSSRKSIVAEFAEWWDSYWKNDRSTAQHAIARGIAFDAWCAGQRAKKRRRR